MGGESVISKAEDACFRLAVFFLPESSPGDAV
jgi:hypothetical protein